MEIELSALEARVLGAFIEKELTTPDYYPLSPNALTNACNQKSNRNPVMQLEEAEVLDAVDSLRKKGLAMQSQDAGSRVVKFRHILREKLYLDEHELAILAELLLRGPQTSGELRSRADRMARFEDLTKLDETLQELIDKEPSLVVKLPRQTGRKEHRYMHLLSGPIDEEELSQPPAVITTGHSSSIATLEEEVKQLKEELAELKEEVKSFLKQFE
ncbi:YceH family protein [Malonomonas rubra]|uniref:YceH family protein n=1 Tax=Malonomonas rubra TaxID=57040 RepID=UPI0026E9D4AC|nr:YceH family protein [Malonomonas rubra]